jgi:hypothetical protein
VSEDTNTPTIADVADFLELLQSAVIETGPDTGYLDTTINPAYLAECISALHRAARRLDPDQVATTNDAAPREYALIQSENANTFATEVTRLLACGWQLYGSPTVAIGPVIEGSNYHLHTQAMTRTKPD